MFSHHCSLRCTGRRAGLGGAGLPRPHLNVPAAVDSMAESRELDRRQMHLGLGEAGEAEVGLDDAEAGEELLGLLVGHGRSDNDVVTGDPVDGGGDAVLVTSLEGVDDAEDLGGVAAGDRKSVV